MDKTSSRDHDPGPVKEIAVTTATIDAQYSHPPLGRKMKYPTRACTVMMAVTMRPTTAMQHKGVSIPNASPSPASISVLIASNACLRGHFIPMLANQEAVAGMVFNLFSP